MNKLKKITIFALTLCLAFFMTLGCSGANANTQKVYVGGTPLGIELSVDGLVVVGKVDVVTSAGISA